MTVFSQVRLMASMGINALGYILTNLLGLPSTSQAAQYPIPKVRTCGPESAEGDCWQRAKQPCTLPPSPPTSSGPHTLLRRSHLPQGFS